MISVHCLPTVLFVTPFANVMCIQFGSYHIVLLSSLTKLEQERKKSVQEEERQQLERQKMIEKARKEEDQKRAAAAKKVCNQMERCVFVFITFP